MSLVKCPECGKSVSDKTDKCPECGYPIYLQNVKTTKCEFCGLENSLGNSICFGCGATLPSSHVENKESIHNSDVCCSVTLKEPFIEHTISIKDNVITFSQNGTEKYKSILSDVYVLYYSKCRFLSNGSLVVLCQGMKTPYELYWKRDDELDMESLVSILKDHCKIKTRASLNDALRCRIDDMGSLWVPK